VFCSDRLLLGAIDVVEIEEIEAATRKGSLSGALVRKVSSIPFHSCFIENIVPKNSHLNPSVPN